MFFGGTYKHSIDAKGRITIPAKLRSLLGEEPVLARGFEGCLNLYSAEGWEEYVKSLLDSKADFNTKRKLKRQLFSTMMTCSYDKQGRILVSPELRVRANLSKDVIIIGVGDYVELWDKVTWEHNDNMDDDEFAALANTVFSDKGISDKDI